MRLLQPARRMVRSKPRRDLVTGHSWEGYRDGSEKAKSIRWQAQEENLGPRSERRSGLGLKKENNASVRKLWATRSRVPIARS